MAKKDVVRLLVRLFGNPTLHRNYRADPDQVQRAAGLSPKERALLSSGDEAAIRAYLGPDVAKANVVKSGLKRKSKGAGPNVVKTALGPNVVKTALGPNVVKTALGPNVVKTALGPNVVKTALGPNVVKTAIRPKDAPKKKPKK